MGSLTRSHRTETIVRTQNQRQWIQIAARIASATNPVANLSHDLRMRMSRIACYCAASFAPGSPLPLWASSPFFNASGCGMVMIL